MKVKYWQKSSFERLRDYWYEKLKEIGFIDAEKTIGECQLLVQNSPNVYRQAPQVVVEAKKQYFDLLLKGLLKKQQLGKKLRERRQDKIERYIIERRSDGAKIVDIATEINWHRQTVRYVIRKYEAKWRIKNWNQEEIAPKWKRWKKKHLIK